jgi:galactokinase
MNLWRFSPRMFEACRRVPRSARGEHELPQAVQWADHESRRALPRRAVRGRRAGPLDARATSQSVGERLREIPVEPVNAEARVEERLRRALADGARRPPQAPALRRRGAALRSAGESAAARRWFVPGRIEVLGKHTGLRGGAQPALRRRPRLLRGRRARGRTASSASPTWPRASLAERPSTRTSSRPRGTGPSTCRRSRRGSRRTFRVPARRGDRDRQRPARRVGALELERAHHRALLRDPRVNALDERPEWRAAIRTPEDLAGYLGSVENGQDFGSLAGRRGAGAFTASEDQTAILCSRPGQLAQYAFLPVRRERDVPLDAEWSFVVASSGVAVGQDGRGEGPLQPVSLAARAILELWNSLGARGATRASTPRRTPPGLPRSASATSSASSRCPASSPRICRAASTSSSRSPTRSLPASRGSCSKGDVVPIGRSWIARRSSRRQALQNQIPETIFLAREARRLGAAAASAFGGGFGGSVWALARTAEAESFRRRWAERYAGEFPAGDGERALLRDAPRPALTEL